MTLISPVYDLNFIENEYLFYYVALVHYWKNQPQNKQRHYEIHHIIPRSLGGSNAKSNLVSLPAEIHLKVHTLLPFFLSGEGKEKMVYAWNMLTNFAGLSDYYDYEYLKKEWSKLTSIRMKGNVPWNKGKTGVQVAWNKGIPWSDEMKIKLSEAQTNSDYVISQETRTKLSKAKSGEGNAMWGLFGDAHPKTNFKESDETKRKKSEALKNYKKTPEHKKNITKSWEARRKNTKTCPHCGFIGCNNMNRYHFDNCKQNT